jgi:hypothetical protein
MLTGWLQPLNHAKFLLEHHSTTILTGVGVGGTVATAVLTGRASFKAAKLIDAQPAKLERAMGDAGYTNGEIAAVVVERTKIEKAKLVWTLYLPPVASGVLTISSIIAANKLSSKKIAALAVAGGISERALQEYKDKVVEKFGDRKSIEVRDDIAQDRVNASAYKAKEVVILGTGDVLCYDMLTGRYFQSSVEQIRKAENKVNFELVHNMSASLSYFFEEVGLEPTSYTDMVGWNSNDPMEVVLSTVMSPDGRPCIAIDFSKAPVTDYDKLWG